jgi:hypothetical protein
MKSYKKEKKQRFENKKFGCTDYISNQSLNKARTLFKHKYSKTENVKMNFKGDLSFAITLWQCKYCMHQDSKSHLLWCSEYEDLRQDFDLKVLQSLGFTFTENSLFHQVGDRLDKRTTKWG